MMLFAFLGMWPTLAVGIGAVAIPVVIHLINRRRFKIVPWAAMRFLLAAQKQTRKRMRIEQLLLMLVRMAILGLLVFAMASVMPWAESLWLNIGLADLGQSAMGRQHRIHHIFVLDASLSMNQIVEGEPAFEIARRKMLQKIQDNPTGDGYSVLLLKESPSWLIGESSQDARRVIREVEAVLPTHGNSSLSVALNMVSAKLTEAQKRFPLQAVYFFTDMQRATWAAAAVSDLKSDQDAKEKSAYLEIQQKATTHFIDVGPMQSPGNLAVTDMWFDSSDKLYVTSGAEVTLNASVFNYGPEARNAVRAELLVGKARESDKESALQLRVQKEDTKNIPSQGKQVFAFKGAFFPAPGTYAVQVKISGDALEQDDVRTTIINVRDTIPVLLVNGKASADRFERATEYLRLVLNPFPHGSEPKGMPLRPRVISPSQFLDMTDADLETYDCIFWCDVGQFGVNELRRLDGHLRRGGGFVVSLGDKSAENLDAYNRLLYKEGRGLLPAKLMKKILAPPDHFFYMQGSDYEEPPLNVFAGDTLTLGTARFRQYVQAEVPEGRARTILSFRTEFLKTEKATTPNVTLPVSAPALVEWNPPLNKAPDATATKAEKRSRQLAHYRGKVLLFNSTVNMDWTSWPGSFSYGPLMHEITRLAMSGRLREHSQPVGSLLEDYLPGGAEVDVTLHYPPYLNLKPATVKTEMVDDVNLFRWGETEFNGVYRVTTRTGEIPFAVNVPVNSADQKDTESDLSRVDETRLRELYPGWNFKILRNPLEAGITSGPLNDDAINTPQPVGPRLANIALLFVLALLFLEIILAWQFGHYSTPEGMMPSKIPGYASTIAAAVIAVASTIFFALGAIIIVDEIRTGDFLGFAPDLLRSWLERVFDVPPPQPGEGTNWHYETAAFLFGLPQERWWAIGISIAALVTILLTYKVEAPKVSSVYKLLLGALRLYLILFTLWFILPRPQLQFARQGWPDMVLLIDDTRSMGEQDSYQDKDAATHDRASKLGDTLREKLRAELPGKLQKLEAELESRRALAGKDDDAKAETDALKQRLTYWEKQKEQIDKNKWRPSRLQLAQALLAQNEPNWLNTLLNKHKTKVHVFHLDINGRAVKLHDLKGDAGEVLDPADPAQIVRASKAIAELEPLGNDSRLGASLRQVIDHYRGSGLSSVVMFTDGVTTRDETIEQAADYAAQKGVALFFVGMGDEHQLRDLRLHDLQVEDTLYLGDKTVLEVRLTGQGYKDLTVPVVLKVKDLKTGKEKELPGRQLIKVDPSGKTIKVRFHDQPTEIGRKRYVIEVESPKVEGNEKPIPQANLRVERTIEVIDTKQLKVLYVEGQPRYEFRYLKFLMERESPDAKKNKSISLNVLLLDADDEFAKADKTAISNFPATLEELNRYDVVILGDCDPNHKKIQHRLKDLVSFVRGEDEKGRKAAKPGGGLLFIAGEFNNPHRYKGTPLADVMPVEPISDKPPPDRPRTERMRPELTEAGRMHPIFKFSPDLAENLSIWQRLTPMYWYSTGYKLKPLAEVLAVHPTDKTGMAKDIGPDSMTKHPLVVQQFVGTGRSMFLGFDETWRWRLRDDESKYNNFWIQTVRYLSRGRSTRTKLLLDRQTPYRLGDPIKITVNFPDNNPGGPSEGPKLSDKTEVKVSVEYQPPDAQDPKTNPRGESELHSIQLAKVEGSWGTYEGTWNRTREGKYRFRLTHPDVSATQPDLEKPSAEAIVELPPGELDRLRMNRAEMTKAADVTQGEFFTLVDADQVLEKLPPGVRVVISSQVPPQLLWNQWWVFAVVLMLITSEWILRKMKHLL